ncbi:MAG: glucoamylase family protein [Candidatus Paceibacterota bacterium]|jgi:cellobiose phosphorylase
MSKFVFDGAIKEELRTVARSFHKEGLLVFNIAPATDYFYSARKNAQKTRESHRRLVSFFRKTQYATQETETLFDNFFVIDGAISDILNLVSKKEFKLLPQISHDSLLTPRVHVLFDAFLRATEGRVDKDSIVYFLSEYQKRNPLSIRELSVLPAILKMLLVDYAQKVIEQSINSIDYYKQSDYWFRQIISVIGKKERSDFSRVLSRLVAEYNILPVEFGMHLLQRLSQYGAPVRAVVRWLRLSFLRQGIDIKNLSKIESDERAARMSIVSNIIESLRWLNQVRWETFVDEINVVDACLCSDPASVYKGLDIRSKNRYLSVLVRMADRLGVHEVDIARTALSLARRHVKQTSGEQKRSVAYQLKSVKSHVGYYLVDDGRKELDAAISYTPSIRERLKRFVLAHPTQVYFLSMFVTWGVLMGAVSSFLFVADISFVSTTSLFVLAAFLGLDGAVIIVQMIWMLFLDSRPIYRMDFSSGISDSEKVCVVTPSMLRSIENSNEQLRRMETNYLGNRDKNIYFVLLMDYKDADSSEKSGDAELLSHIQSGVIDLNKKYADGEERFFVLIRKRLWNQSEGAWMGWERKRGKLREFNHLLSGDVHTTYILNNPFPLSGSVQHIITIDEDTELVRESARELIASIVHPLSKPVIDYTAKKVIRGYGIIQPRTTTRLRNATKSLFSRLFASSVGIDSYNGPVSDVYQDLFGAGIFFGKGIYNIEAVEVTMGDSIPENAVLSHDLLEGIYARVGFASDIYFFEGFPSTYSEYIHRHHRWVRGDWQIFSWIFSRAKKHTPRAQHFDSIDIWKIADNLRRSIVPVAIVLFVAISWVSRGSVDVFLWLPAIIISMPLFLPVLLHFFSWEKGMSTGKKLRGTFADILKACAVSVIRISLILHIAYTTVGAILLVFWRMFISHKKLLEWNSSQDVSVRFRGTIIESIRLMWVTSLISALCFITSISEGRTDFFSYIYFFFGFTAPIVAYFVSITYIKNSQLSLRDIQLLRMIAYKTSRFFLDFSSREPSGLIPDHFQEEPKQSTFLSHLATSPTNIGMLFSSFLSAYDFGFLSPDEFIERTSHALNSLGKLERYKGHLYNWYDIGTLTTLTPRYVSSVDSANFIMALTAFLSGVRHIISEPIQGSRMLTSMSDACLTLSVSLKKVLRTNNFNRKIRKLIERTLLYTLRMNTDCMAVRKATDPVELKKTFAHLYVYTDHLHALSAELSVQDDAELMNEIYLIVRDIERLLLVHEKSLVVYAGFALGRNEISNIVTQKHHKLFGAYNSLRAVLSTMPSMKELATLGIRKEIEGCNFLEMVNTSDIEFSDKEQCRIWFQKTLTLLSVSEHAAIEFISASEKIISDGNHYIDEADFSFLYNKERGLFHIGFNELSGNDNSFYDFLASESNSVSFISIMKGQVPKKQWFYLARKLVNVGGISSLYSWGGSLFEYLTSLLFLDVHDESILGTAARVAIASHIQYGRTKRTPWGMGESAYNSFDINQNYQYQIFGHPDLGLKRGLSEYLVVAPYTTVLSLPFEPVLAVKNLRRLIREGVSGEYGLYDAVDFVDEQGSRFRKGVPAKIYYAHHQGFILSALNNTLNNGRLRKLFHSDNRVASADAVLEELFPKTIPDKPVHVTEVVRTKQNGEKTQWAYSKEYIPILTATPRYAFLSNGSYSVAISNAGSGWSTYNGIALTRFREDPVMEKWGTFIYLKDLDRGSVWSPTLQPSRVMGKRNKILFYENMAEFHGAHNGIESLLQITVPKDRDVELRLLTLTNKSNEVRHVEVASYSETVLTKPGQDIHHPLFAKLFVKSEFDEQHEAVISERPLSFNSQQKIFFGHAGIVKDSRVPLRYFRNRETFVGRLGSVSRPQALIKKVNNSDTDPDYTLDPISSIARTVTLRPGEVVQIAFVSVASFDKNVLLRTLKHYSRVHKVVSEFTEDNRTSDETCRAIGITRERALLFQDLGSRLFAGDYSSNKKLPTENISYIQTLWKYGISGDEPILTVVVKDINGLALIRQVLIAHSYLQYKGLSLDIVILNEYPASYIKIFDDEIDFLIRHNRKPKPASSGGNVYHVKAAIMSDSDMSVILASSRCVISQGGGSVEEQIRKGNKIPHSGYTEKFVPTHPLQKNISIKDDFVRPTSLWNGLGGYDDSTGEYVIRLESGVHTPSPWSNIVANPRFGFVVTESGAGYTWSDDSYDNRITAWHNDPLLDKSSEIMYVRDNATGDVWCPTPRPLRAKEPYVIRHGQGYSIFEHTHSGVTQKMTMFVPTEGRAKITTYTLKNTSDQEKDFTFTNFFELSLGVSREQTKHFLEFSRDEKSGVVLVKNKYRNNFSSRVVAFDFNSGNCIVSTDKMSIIGRHGSVYIPQVLRFVHMIENLGYTHDSCLAMQSRIVLAPGEEKTFTMVIAEADSELEAVEAITSFRKENVVSNTLVQVKNFWKGTLGTFRLESPDVGLNALFNTWLLYQAVSARLFAKTGYYQPSGAYGFRDQLQDILSLLWTDPRRVREFIVKVAGHQFTGGDGENWWHEHNMFGVRTVLSDHQLWLVYAVGEYISVTGDESILDETAPFLEAPELDFQHNKEWAGVPTVSLEQHSLYEHCVRAIGKTLRLGVHGLPLMGMGDWNDGLNKVGDAGRGESVWVGWFLYYILMNFAPLSEKRQDSIRAGEYYAHASLLKKNLNTSGWDKQWYRRAYLDNGIPLGSSKNKEFKIDSVAQSWAVISGAGEKGKIEKAMVSLEKYLLPHANSIRLIAPVLRKSVLDIGYIKEYPPGVRENGAQYNHAAVWVAQAFAKMGNGDMAKNIIDRINPFNRTADKKSLEKYRVEPYVLASDIYINPSYDGRGGWTWYSGSAGVLYRTLLQSVLGITIKGDTLEFNPCLPSDWKKCTLVHLHKTSTYTIQYIQDSKKKTGKTVTVHLDGVLVTEKIITLVDDGLSHTVIVSISE